MIDTSAVESALINKLALDPELHALLPDGVFYDLAPEGLTKYVIVSLFGGRSRSELNNGETFRALVYLVKAVALTTGGTLMADADRRINELLHHGTLDLSGAGCSLMVMRWADRERRTEADPADVSGRWQQRGAKYKSPSPPRNERTRPMRRHGSQGQVKMDPTGGATTVVVAALNSWTGDFKRDRADATCFGDPNKVYLLGLPNAEGDIGGIWDEDESPALFNVAFGDVPANLELVPSNLAPTYLFKGLAYIDAGIDVKADGAITVKGTWAAAGPFVMAP